MLKNTRFLKNTHTLKNAILLSDDIQNEHPHSLPSFQEEDTSNNDMTSTNYLPNISTVKG